MAFDDFAKQFSHLDLVHIGPDDWMSEPSLQSKKPWRAVLARRRWRQFSSHFKIVFSSKKFVIPSLFYSGVRLSFYTYYISPIEIGLL